MKVESMEVGGSGLYVFLTGVGREFLGRVGEFCYFCKLGFSGGFSPDSAAEIRFEITARTFVKKVLAVIVKATSKTCEVTSITVKTTSKTVNTISWIIRFLLNIFLPATSRRP